LAKGNPDSQADARSVVQSKGKEPEELKFAGRMRALNESNSEKGATMGVQIRRDRREPAGKNADGDLR